MAMNKEKELYKVKSIHEAFYTGGFIKVFNDGSLILCHCGSSIQVLDVDSGKVCSYLGDPSQQEDADTIICFNLSQDNQSVITSHRSGLLKLWKVEGTGSSELVKQWKAIHKGPVVQVEISSDNKVVVTGGSDSSIRVWDLEHNSCTQNLKGCPGVISCLKLKENEKECVIFAAGNDWVLRGWDLETGSLIYELPSHYSTVTSIDFYEHYMVSCGRDKVMTVWDLSLKKAIHTIPLYESVESVSTISDFQIIPGQDVKLKPSFFVSTGGENGVVRIWDLLNCKEVFTQTNSLMEKTSDRHSFGISHILYNRITCSLIVSSFDHNIFIYDLGSFACKKQFVGFSDEIMSIILVGSDESHLCVATNSCDIRLYCLATMNCNLLRGHKDYVMALASSKQRPDMFLSSSKDFSVRVWLLDSDCSSAVCIAVGTRHSDSVNALATPNSSSSYAISGSNDTTIKLWNLPKKLSAKELEPEVLNVKHTVKGHDKEINDICVSPNDKLLVTTSDDKTAKLWLTSNLSLVGTLVGHKKSVWACRFSPVDQVILTSSADATLKLWSVVDLTCLKTLESGEKSSIICAEFLTCGTQIISSSADGILHLWSIKTSEKIAAFDNHSGKLWALAVSRSEKELYTGGSDSRLVVWEDWSEHAAEERLLNAQEIALNDQKLANLIQAKRNVEAISLAITLDRPKTLFKIFEDILKSNELSLGKEVVANTILGLEDDKKLALLRYSTHWNTNSKYCYIAQLLISILVVDMSFTDGQGLKFGSCGIDQEVIEALLPYTERHFHRLTQLLQDLLFISYTKHKINPVIDQSM